MGDLDESVLSEQVGQFEAMILGFLDHQFGLNPDFLSSELCTGLRNNLLQAHQNGEMHSAGIGRQSHYQKNVTVRGDLIKWIDNDSSDPFERAFLNKINAFVAHLNRSCFAGINDFEFHYAYYDVGSFYKRHLDQFSSDRGRQFSLVTYLNDQWLAQDEGHLVICLPSGEDRKILPQGGKSVFFKSDQLVHEVLPSPTRYRLSITGWLKKI